jgi:DNA polymerase-1
MAAFNLTGDDALEKDSMRTLVMSGGPWSREEQVQILDYCQSDVDALARLLPAMLPKIDLPALYGLSG